MHKLNSINCETKKNKKSYGFSYGGSSYLYEIEVFLLVISWVYTILVESFMVLERVKV